MLWGSDPTIFANLFFTSDKVSPASETKVFSNILVQKKCATLIFKILVDLHKQILSFVDVYNGCNLTGKLFWIFWESVLGKVIPRKFLNFECHWCKLKRDETSGQNMQHQEIKSLSSHQHNSFAFQNWMSTKSYHFFLLDFLENWNLFVSVKNTNAESQPESFYSFMLHSK